MGTVIVIDQEVQGRCRWWGVALSGGLWVATMVWMVGCAHNAERGTRPLHFSETSASLPRDVVDSTPASGVVPYSFQNESYDAEWMTCRLAAATRSVLVMHRDHRGFDPATFCRGWITQVFLAAGYSVVGLNRPGFGRSSGRADFAGPQSVAAMEAARSHALATLGSGEAHGAWGYSSGATAAALLSRKMGTLKWIILGGGLYNLHDALAATKDSYLKSEIESVLDSGGDLALEVRSVAYDLEGLPRRVLIYHGTTDAAAPVDQARALSDSLVSMGYQATFQGIDGMGHDLAAGHHRQLVEIMMQQVPR